jgi:hypothetical protein
MMTEKLLQLKMDTLKRCSKQILIHTKSIKIATIQQIAALTYDKKQR